MSLTIDQLFTPVQSGVGLDPNVPPPDDTWLATLLSLATQLQLPTTSWQPGAPERTILAITAVALSQEDVLISMQAQGGFLDFAAAGTVTTVGLNGIAVTEPVTPDPSIPSQNPTGAPGWLDALGQSFYEVDRLLATLASGPLAIANTSPGTITYATAGTYHVANAITGATYANAAALSIPPSSIAGSGGVITGVTVGSSVTQITTQAAHGLAVNDVVYISGTAGVSNLNGAFAYVTAVTSTTFTIARATSGLWTGGGTVYKCTLATMAADVAGISSNAAAGQVTATVTQNTGVYVYNLAAWSAANYESNAAYAARCRLKLGALSPNGPSQAYEYFALTAQVLLSEQVPAVTLTNGPIDIATTFSNPQTGVVTTYVSSTSPATTTLGQAVTPGCADLAITDASFATPIVITTATAHGLQTGDFATVSGVLGNAAANGTWTIARLSSTTFSLNTSVGNGFYVSGGTVNGGDLGQVNRLIQANVVPDGVTALVRSALAFPVTVVATVVVPQAYVATYQAAAVAALQALIASYPIGGNIPSGETDGTVPYSAIEGALAAAGVVTVGAVSYVREVTTLTVNGGTTDVTYPGPNYVAQLPAPTITVVGV